MDTANMSHTSDDSNSSDDLIAELARLMAQDAQGEAPESAPSGAPAQTERRDDALHTESPFVDADKPAEDLTAASRPQLRIKPTFSGTPSGLPSTHAASPSERLDASGGSDSLYDEAERAALHTPSLKLTPTFQKPSTRSNLLRDTMDDESNGNSQDFDRHNDVPTEQIRQTEDRFFDRAPDDNFSEPVFNPPNETPSEPLAEDLVGTLSNSAPGFGAKRFSETNDPFFASENVAQPSVADPDDDPIGALISARLAEEGNTSDFGTERAPAEPVLGDGSESENSIENDNFVIPPVFGLGNSVGQPAQPAVSARDPLDDIEDLIGEAVRSGYSDPTPAQQIASSDAKENEPAAYQNVGEAASAAEATILAAEGAVRDDRAVSQARSEPIDTPFMRDGVAVDSEVAFSNVEKTPSIWMRMAGPVVAGGLLLAVGLGLYWAFGSGIVDDGEVPVLSADATPVKTVPETVEETSSAANRSIVFEQTSNNDGSAAASNEQLVSRDQSVTTAADGVSRVIGTDETADSGLANRKVRTVTVRSDGTIVSGDDALAGAEVLPVERPDVPELPADVQTAASEFINEPIVSTGADDIVVADVAEQVASDLTTEASSSTQATNIPIPRPRISNRVSTVSTIASPLVTNSTPAGSAGNAAVDLIAATANQAVTQTVATTPVVNTNANLSDASAYVQLSSQRTEQAAQTSLNEIRNRFGSSLGSASLEIQRVDLGERGIFFRVRQPATSLDSANTICGNVKLNGGDCFVRSN